MTRFRSPFALASATQYLIVASIIVYAVQILNQPKAGSGFLDIFDISRITPFELTFGLIAPPQIPQVFWQLFTYMFLHGALWHILFNMYALWLFGHILERVWGPKRFLIYYFFTGVGAGITTVIVSLITGELSLSVGASGAIYGVLLAFAMLFPNQPLYLFFIPVPIPAKYAVLGLGVLAFLFSATGAFSSIGHLAHLGGLLFGIIYLKGRRWLLWLMGR